MRTLHRTSGRAQQTTRRVDGSRVHISVWTDAPGAEYDGRIELNHEDKTERWAFGIHGGRTVEVLATNAVSGIATEPDLPDWVHETVTEMGLEAAE
ncbi:MAG: hypothetical protein V5A55_12505 [Halovenus sp.]